MKKLYFTLFTLALLAITADNAMAQLRANTSGKANVGYAKYDDQIWEYDGLSLDHNAKVGCAIVLTRDMLKPYIGGTVTGMRVGWDTSESTGKYSGFVRNTFNGEDLSTGTATVSYSYSSSSPGWNNMTMSKYVIPEDVEQLVVGFTTNLKKDVCAIPTLYPHNTPNSCFLWVEGDNDEHGNPAWVDMSERGILPILLTIQDTEGTFNFLPVVQSINHDAFVQTDEAGSALVRLKNAGSVTINSLEVTSTQGEQSKSQKVSLSPTISPGNTSKPFLVPVFAFHSGDVELSITKVNNQSVSNPETRTLNVFAIPAAIAKKHPRRPLVEYYESENSYMAPRYYDEYVGPVMENRFEDFTYVSQHLDDQFMTGEDDATKLALLLCDNDSAAISIPAMTVDRTISTSNILYQMNTAWSPMFSVLLEPYASNFLDGCLEVPTFLDVNVSGTLAQDDETLTVTVGGDGSDMAACMPEGEKARVTVYLMERDVTSDSQLFWTEKEKEETMGEYTHVNVIREILSATEGDEIENGNIKGEYTTMLDPTWNKQNLYLVAFVHRDSKHGGQRMQVINSCEGDITFTSGITSSLVNSQSSLVYDLQGRRTSKAGRGVYIIDGKKVVR